MLRIELTRKSEESLNTIKRKDIKTFNSIIDSIKELESLGLKCKSIKNIGNSIFRKRIGRWRILFTQNKDILTIWIIEQEKDTKKDYKIWKDYIISQIKYY